MNKLKAIALVGALTGMSVTAMANPAGHPHNYSGKDNAAYENVEKQRWSHLKQHRDRGGVYVAKGESKSSATKLNKHITRFNQGGDKAANNTGNIASN